MLESRKKCGGNEAGWLDVLVWLLALLIARVVPRYVFSLFVSNGPAHRLELSLSLRRARSLVVRCERCEKNPLTPIS